jgi:hypothetical protein
VKTYRVDVVCEQDGVVALHRDGVPEPVAQSLLREAPQLDAAIAALKAGAVLKGAPGKLASKLAALLGKTD